MKRLRHVAVLIETSREYGRGLLRGVARFHHEHAAWSIYFKPHDLGSALPDWLASWSGDGILARITNRTMADVLLATNLPLIDLRGGGIPAGSSNTVWTTSPFAEWASSTCAIAA